MGQGVSGPEHPILAFWKDYLRPLGLSGFDIPKKVPTEVGFDPD